MESVARATRASVAVRYQRLVDLLAARVPASPVTEAAEWRDLVRLAHAEGVAPLLGHAVRGLPETDVPLAVREELAATYHQAVCSSLLQESVRTRVCRWLRERGISMLLLKGAALAFMCYEDPATRPMVDLDLLVPASRFEEAEQCLMQGGYRPIEVSAARSHTAYLHASTGSLVELHWRLRVLGRAQEEALPEIWSGAWLAPRAEGALVMRWGHTIPLLCAHMLLQHQQASLLWLYDLHRVLLATDLAEAALARDAACRWHLEPCTAQALLRVRELFGTPLPEVLGAWAEAAAARDSLQARLSALALQPGAAGLPSADLVDLVTSRDRSLLRALFPRPADLRARLGMGAHASVAPAYAALMVRHLRHGPGHVWRLWRSWHLAPRPRPVLPPEAPGSPTAWRGPTRESDGA